MYRSQKGLLRREGVVEDSREGASGNSTLLLWGEVDVFCRGAFPWVGLSFWSFLLPFQSFLLFSEGTMSCLGLS